MLLQPALYTGRSRRHPDPASTAPWADGPWHSLRWPTRQESPDLQSEAPPVSHLASPPSRLLPDR
jgi:hypothetical protein